MYLSTFICLAFQVGYTPIHIAAKYGHVDLINKFAEGHVNLRQLSRKTGNQFITNGDVCVYSYVNLFAILQALYRVTHQVVPNLLLT